MLPLDELNAEGVEENEKLDLINSNGAVSSKLKKKVEEFDKTGMDKQKKEVEFSFGQNTFRFAP